MEAIILAGGLGTRLREQVPDLPKPMAPVGGRPFLEHQIDYWIDQGVSRFILSVGYKREVIERRFGDMYRDAEITYAVEDKPLGTGGGLLLSVGKLKKQKSFILLNGDTFFEVDLSDMENLHSRKNSDVTVALHQVKENMRYGSVKLESDARITDFNGAPDAGNSLINGGVYIINKTALDATKWRAGDSFSVENDLFPAMIESSARFYGYVSNGRFIDIGVPEDYQRSGELLGKR
ncbi:MAG: nucleotidyltransferase family protein [Nitrospinota bacterium]